MKKQLILLLVAFTIISNLDAAAQRFYNWCANNSSRIAFATGALLGSGATTYYWKNRNQPVDQSIEETPKTETGQSYKDICCEPYYFKSKDKRRYRHDRVQDYV
jgi:hypothetical protein